MAANLKNLVSIITGSGTGIGKATAIRFAKLGSRLALVGRQQSTLLETKEDCLKCSELTADDILCISADVGVEEDIKSIVTKTVAHFNRIDVLVNNAGHSAIDSTEEFNPAHFDSLMNVHVRGVALLTKFASPHLIKSKGNIVNVSSIAGLRPFANFLSYCAAKAAVKQITRVASIELGPKGVRVNAVNPGLVKTTILNKMGVGDSAFEDIMKKTIECYPLRRICEPEEVASTISFLASSDASFINGVCLSVDGGLKNTILQ